jgi:pilus assembly protein CpaF
VLAIGTEFRKAESHLGAKDATERVRLHIQGEIRGGEAFDLLQLLNTGHSGTLSTVHANSAAQGISRFTTCVLQSGVEMPYLAIKSNIAESLNVIVQIERRPGRRFASEVLDIRGYNLSTDQYDFHPVTVATRGPGTIEGPIK